MKQLFVNTDGGSRGNPGPAAIGVAFFDENGNIIQTDKECIGVATNNEAEYKAIIRALTMIQRGGLIPAGEISTMKVVCRLDSLLVVEQINGHWKVKQEHIAKFISEIRALLTDLKLNISFIHIPREQNKMADKLVNEALDAKS